MMSEAIDETLDKDEAKEETKELTNQVLDEIGVDIASLLSSAPKGRIRVNKKVGNTSRLDMAAEVAKWSVRDETTFIQIMADQVRKGNRAITFVPRAWYEIAVEFKAKTEHDWPIYKLKNKFNKLRVAYREFKKLLDKPTGFEWDPVTKTMTAPDDVWENYLNANPHARQFKNKGCPNFDDMELIYGNATVKGAVTRTSIKPPLDSNDGSVEVGGQSQNRDVGEDDDIDCEIQEQPEARGRSRTPTSSRRRKRDESSSMDSALLAFREADEFRKFREVDEFRKFRAEMLQSRTVKATDFKGDPYSVPNATKVLMEIPNLPMGLLVKVGKEIIKVREFRQFFITFDDERRLDMLHSMFGSS